MPLLPLSIAEANNLAISSNVPQSFKFTTAFPSSPSCSRCTTEAKNHRVVRFYAYGELQRYGGQGCAQCAIIAELVKHVYKDLLNSMEFNYSLTKRALDARPLGTEMADHTVQLFTHRASAVRLHPLTQAYPLDGNREKAVERIKKWLTECFMTHNKCRPHADQVLPSRLIDVLTIFRNGKPGVHLAQPKTPVPYTCLSHCWGNVRIHCLTKKENYEEYLKFIDLEQIPPTFQHAINITRSLGLRYVWIDSMCIIQDSASDWDSESAKMGAIYRSAELTIAASASPDSTHGVFASSAPTDLCFLLTSDVAPSMRCVLGARMAVSDRFTTTARDVFSTWPLWQRGWVFQERMLSRRMACFLPGEVIFQCLQDVQCECESGLAPRVVTCPPTPGGRRSIVALSSAMVEEIRAKIHGGVFSDVEWIWPQIVMQYSTLLLTYDKDRLPALSACANIVASWMGDEYLAGLWKRTIHRGFLWYNAGQKNSDSIQSKKDAKDAKRELDRPDWVAPTWSWASLPSGTDIRFMVPKGESQTEWKFRASMVVHATCKPKGVDRFGQVIPEESYLVVRTRVFPCSARWRCKLDRPKQNRNWCGLVVLNLHLNPMVCSCPMSSQPLDLGAVDQHLLWDSSRAATQGTVSRKDGQCYETPVFLMCIVMDRPDAGSTQNKRRGMFFVVLSEVEDMGEGCQYRVFRRIGLLRLIFENEEGARICTDKAWNQIPEEVIKLI